MLEAKLATIEKELEKENLSPEEEATLWKQWDVINKALNDRQEKINIKQKEKEIARATQLLQEREENARQKALAITDEEVDSMYSNFHILNAGQVDANGRTFEEWFDQSLKLYTITATNNGYNLTSNAKGEKGFTWEMVSIAHARSKILELIKIKFRDHHNRPDRAGCDFKYIPQSE